MGGNGPGVTTPYSTPDPFANVSALVPGSWVETVVPAGCRDGCRRREIRTKEERKRR